MTSSTSYRQKFLGRGKAPQQVLFLIQSFFIVPGIFQEQLSSFENQAVLTVSFSIVSRIRERLNILVIVRCWSLLKSNNRFP